MSNGWSKLTIHEKSSKLLFFMVYGAKKILDNLGFLLGMALHHLIEVINHLA
jgi:hypothetical protein